MFIGPLIALGLVLAAGALALFSAHLPLIRTWTGAAPLQADDDPAVTEREVTR